MTMAEVAKEYIIRIVAEAKGESEGTVNKTVKRKRKKKDDKEKPFITKMAIGGAFIAGKALRFTSTQIGTLTGDQYLQDGINTTMKMLGHAGHIVAEPFTGLVNLSFSLISGSIMDARKARWEEMEKDNLRLKTGYSLRNKSRY